MNPKLVFPVLVAYLAFGAADLVGGLTDADINDPRVQDALKFAVLQYNTGTYTLYLIQVTKVMKAQQQQVDDGMMYRFTVQMMKTLCRKPGPDQRCPVYQDRKKAPPYQCTFEVLTRAWFHFYEVKESTCN
ncbi:cystatin-like [Lampris incognitus]|uniref:cystatin-like n=1 Tax=Lampris incognitus TaxID=2546036 RepID=UPI0024B4D5E3|nr:cystatin-like [Lampris incognitus]